MTTPVAPLTIALRVLRWNVPLVSLAVSERAFCGI